MNKMRYRLVSTTQFNKEYKKLSKQEQAHVRRKTSMLAEDPFHPSLRVKKIKTTEEFECSVNMDIRIAFSFEGDAILLMLDVGHHNDVLRRRTR